MSQERTRFPIQPKDVRRSAKSNKDMRIPGQSGQGAEGRQSDKPTTPPHQRARAADVDETPGPAADADDAQD